MNGFLIENSQTEANPPFWSSKSAVSGHKSQGHTVKLGQKSLSLKVPQLLQRAKSGQRKVLSKLNLHLNPKGSSVKKINSTQLFKQVISRN